MVLGKGLFILLTTNIFMVLGKGLIYIANDKHIHGIRKGTLLYC